MPCFLALPSHLAINIDLNIFRYHLYEIIPTLHFISYFSIYHILFSIYHVIMLNPAIISFDKGSWDGWIICIYTSLGKKWFFFKKSQTHFHHWKYKKNQIYGLNFIGEMWKQHFYSELVHGVDRTFLRVIATWPQWGSSGCCQIASWWWEYVVREESETFLFLGLGYYQGRGRWENGRKIGG